MPSIYCVCTVQLMHELFVIAEFLVGVLLLLSVTRHFCVLSLLENFYGANASNKKICKSQWVKRPPDLGQSRGRCGTFWSLIGPFVAQFQPKNDIGISSLFAFLILTSDLSRSKYNGATVVKHFGLSYLELIGQFWGPTYSVVCSNTLSTYRW